MERTTQRCMYMISDKAKSSLHVMYQIVRTQTYRETHMYVYVYAWLAWLHALSNFKIQIQNKKQIIQLQI